MQDLLLVAQFADFIAERWRTGYQHTYPITGHRAWNSWRDRHGGQNLSWSCESLAQAAQHCCWTPGNDELSFADLAKGLQQAVTAGDETLAKRLCYDIYRWGGVAIEPTDCSRAWVRQASQNGHLTKALCDAVSLLAPASTEPLYRFNEDDLLMTSATTKLYAAAAADSRVAIYDGRVGAGLGLLARQFLEARQIEFVPDVLHFRWGPPRTPVQARARTRDPSSARHRFRQLPNGARSHRIRAELSRRTNMLFQAVTDRLEQRQSPVSFIELERALFMIGYCVRSRRAKADRPEVPGTRLGKSKIIAAIAGSPFSSHCYAHCFFCTRRPRASQRLARPARRRGDLELHGPQDRRQPDHRYRQLGQLHGCLAVLRVRKQRR